MPKYILAVAIFLQFFSSQAEAQSRKTDSLMHVPMIYAGGGFDLSGGDMAQRFGNNFEVGGGFLFKTKTNWLFGADFSYLFGETIKERPLDSLRTQDGFLLGEDGLDADVRITERGIKLPIFKAGKLFSAPVGRASVNSGFFIMGGVGFMQHKINYEDVTRSLPQIRGEYQKGYDRLTNGLAITQNLGYMYLDKRRRINFFANLEFTQAFTKNRREYNFDQMRKDDASRLDLLYGIKLGWIFPIYKKLPQEFYYD
ncbi:hypothetical protein [Adhaeribacter terreus]|uniref:Outer membrane protein beta-barrel domain-containing protein n=1 Tax=Adhaeribacter terreus TaxID=529703 RepID=A0ABW0E4E2_9BACT